MLVLCLVEVIGIEKKILTFKRFSSTLASYTLQASFLHVFLESN